MMAVSALGRRLLPCISISSAFAIVQILLNIGVTSLYILNNDTNPGLIT
jgi:hypothetical protein